MSCSAHEQNVVPTSAESCVASDAPLPNVPLSALVFLTLCLPATQEKIPGFAQSLIILPRVAKYNKLYVQPIQCVVEGKAPVPQKSFFAKLFAKS
jgi:hypothetical protein